MRPTGQRVLCVPKPISKTPAQAAFRNRSGIKTGFPVRSAEVCPRLWLRICAVALAIESSEGHCTRRCGRGDRGPFSPFQQRTG